MIVDALVIDIRLAVMLPVRDAARRLSSEGATQLASNLSAPLIFDLYSRLGPNDLAGDVVFSFLDVLESQGVSYPPS